MARCQCLQLSRARALLGVQVEHKYRLKELQDLSVFGTSLACVGTTTSPPHVCSRARWNLYLHIRSLQSIEEVVQDQLFCLSCEQIELVK